VLGLVARASAQDVRWQAADAPSPSPSSAVTLQAPVALDSPRPLQTVNRAAPPPASLVVRAKMIDPPAPQVVDKGQQLDIIPRPMPSFGPQLDSTTQAPKDSSAGTDVSNWVGGGGPGPGAVISQGTVMDGCCGDPCCDDVCCGICGLRGWFASRFCGDCCWTCECDGCCRPRPVFWVSAEYLLWTVKNGNTPPLVTLNPNGFALPVIGVPGTQVVSGGTQDYDIRSGGKFTLGFGLPCVDFGLETTYFFLGDRMHQAAFASAGTPSLGRPFIDVGPETTGFPGNQNAELVALQGVLGGSVVVKTTSSMWGLEENIRQPICCGPNYKLDFLGGFRYLQLDESLQISENLTLNQPVAGGSSTFAVVDRFHTRNDFYGGSVGIDGEWYLRRWFLGGTFKFGMGDTHEVINIDGSTTTNTGVTRGGLLTQLGSNIGRFGHDRFAVLPEAALKVGYNFTCHWRAYVGYDVIYLSNVVRPGDQVDINVNPTLLPGNGPPRGPLQPAFQVRTTDFWAQGINFGMELRW
jgi:hypothetical protein